MQGERLLRVAVERLEDQVSSTLVPEQLGTLPPRCVSDQVSLSGCYYDINVDPNEDIGLHLN